jgi:hypothetical protein
LFAQISLIDLNSSAGQISAICGKLISSKIMANKSANIVCGGEAFFPGLVQVQHQAAAPPVVLKA